MTRTSIAARRRSRSGSTGGMGERTARRLAWTSFGVISLLFAFAFLGVGAAAPSGTGSGDVLFVLMSYSFPLVGILILARLPKNTIGWILMGIGFTWGLSNVTNSLVLYALGAGNRKLAALVDALSSWLWVPAITIMGTYLILLFPDGRLPSPRWRIVGWLAALSIAGTSLAITFAPGPIDGVTRSENPLGIESLETVLSVLIVSIVLIPLCIVASAVSLIRRFRRSHGVERLQLKWVTAGTAAVAILYAVAIAVSLNTSWGMADTPLYADIAQQLATASFFLIPVSIGIAILKHRLFDIVIKKAVIYGSLAAFITAVYVAIVAGAGALLGAGGDSNLALSIFATAVVAVAFQPVRERVQRFANRLVYGKRASPYEVLSRFSQTVASSYGAEDLLPYTASTLREATSALRSTVWLHQAGRLVAAAASP
ncbi:MAG: hypothetical protein H0W21_00180, partial [Actinobacteria bacterium]|nr:hypothetical protein [Actinomycetota bacterium]